MEWRDLGVSGLRLPAVGLGAHQAFDVNGREAQLARASLVQAVLRDGVSLFHTSDEYRDSSRVLGAALLPSRGLATVMTSVTAPDWREGQRHIDRMLHYFDGYVDLCAYALPHDGPDYGRTLDRLRSRGETSAIGIRVDRGQDCRFARRVIEDRMPDYIELPYYPDDDPEREVLIAAAAQLGIGVVAIAPFRGGRLARLHPPSANLHAFAHLGIETWPQLIIKWILSNRHITSVIIGTRRAVRLRDATDAAAPPWMSGEERKRVLAILGGMRRG